MSNCCLKTKLLSIQSQESAEILLSNLIQINICVNCLSCLNSKLENEIVVNPTQESAGILPSNLIQVNIEIANYLELSQLSSQHWNCKLSRIVSVVNPTQESAGIFAFKSDPSQHWNCKLSRIVSVVNPKIELQII